MFKVCDIVRHKDKHMKGLYEITGVYENETYQYTITNNECDSEHYVRHNDLYFVCAYENRRDLD